MRILVAHASRHGGTTQIAEAVASELQHALADSRPDSAGSSAPSLSSDRAQTSPARITVCPVDEVDDVVDYDVVIVGSAIYLGRWLKGARVFIRANAVALAQRPVWLFSSGPVGDPLEPVAEPEDVAELAELIGAREHHTFAGRLRRADLNLAERAAVRVVHAAEGDYRDWDDVRGWADAIADGLAPAPTGP